MGPWFSWDHGCKVVSVSLLSFCVCFCLLSIGYFYHSDRIGEGDHQPIVGLYFLNFSHEKEDNITFFVPVFLWKKLILAQLGSPYAWTSQPFPWEGLDLTNLGISSVIIIIQMIEKRGRPLLSGCLAEKSICIYHRANLVQACHVTDDEKEAQKSRLTKASEKSRIGSQVS